MKKYFKRWIAVAIMIAGIGLMGYPWISNWLYDHSVESTVETYEKQMDEADSAALSALWEEAQAYNRMLSQSRITLTDPFVETAGTEENLSYYDVLDVNQMGLMCFVEIPKIDVYLPVFHGTSPEVLEKGVGHLEGSSLPVGGAGTHAVLSAHTGINRSKLFSDLTQVEEGDLFFLHVLDKTLAYRVGSVEVIEPEDTSLLTIEEGRDLVSLLTCTPYGQNTYRLVVTGERTEYAPELLDEAQREEPGEDTQWMRAYKQAVLIGICLVASAAVLGKAAGRFRNRKEDEHADQETVV